MPSSRAAYATPWAWLPPLTATTPRDRSSSESVSILLNAPRGLNEPVFWRHSSLSETRAPSRPLSVALGTSGVRWTRPRTRSRACWIMSSVSMSTSPVAKVGPCHYIGSMAKKRKPAAEPTVTFWGAARTVTGSMHQLDACGQSLLLDCGLFQGPRAETYHRNLTFPFRPKDIDAVLLSHAHIDHCGNLPNLVKQGFAGEIWCTPATRALVAVMLGDAAKIHEEDANYLNRKRARGEPKIEPLYEGIHVYRTLLRLKAAQYDTPVKVGRGIEATFTEAGHLLGSAMVHVRMEAPGGERT